MEVTPGVTRLKKDGEGSQEQTTVDHQVNEVGEIAEKLPTSLNSDFAKTSKNQRDVRKRTNSILARTSELETKAEVCS